MDSPDDIRKSALFLDRDGTIIEDRGHLGSPSEVVFYPGTFDALRRLADDFLFFIITSQVGIAKGLITQEQVDRVNQHVVEVLKKEGITITDVYVCPHRKEDACQCRKPSPYFLHKAERDYGIDLSTSFMIGDHPPDVDCALNAGAQGIFVLTGHGQDHKNEMPEGTVIVPGIEEAVSYIAGKGAR